MNFKSKAFIIKTKKFAEADKLITAVNQRGEKIRFIGKGASRVNAKMSGYLNLFNYLDLVLAEGRNLDIVTSAEMVINFKNLEKDLRKTGIAFLMAEALDKLLEDNQEHYGLINLVLSCYKWLDQIDSKKAKRIINFFLLNLSSQIGFKPELNNCASCGKELNPDKIYFSYADGGLICKECLARKQATEITVPEVKIMRLYLSVGSKINLYNLKQLEIFEKIDDNLDNKISKILYNYFDYTTDRKFISKNFLQKIERL